MKKIIIFARVKNEDDIIESFCRYNLTYSDCMLIMDDGSDDNTKEIIQNLINEGLPIKLIQGLDRAIYDIEKFNVSMVNIALNEYGADLIIPLDADEFLYHTDGINPRETLEALQENIEYQAIWRTYVYEKEPDIALGFMPNNFTYYRNPEMENPEIYPRHKKIISSKYLFKSKKAKIIAGSHFLKYTDEYKNDIKTEIHEKLVFAHFPIRSKIQLKKKVIPFWISKWGMNNRAPRDILDIHQLGILFNAIKENGDIPHDKIVKYSIEYAMLLDFSISGEMININIEKLDKIKNDLGSKLEISGSLNTSFCKDKLKLRYTNYNENNIIFMKSMLKETDNTIMFLNRESSDREVYINNLNQTLNENNIKYKENISKLEYEQQVLENKYKNLINENNNLIIHYNNLSNDKKNLIINFNNLTEERDNLLNSRSWRITKPLRYISRKINGLKRKDNEKL